MDNLKRILVSKEITKGKYKMTTRCAIYIRVSTIKQEEKGFSLDWQRKNLLEIAESKKWQVGKTDIYDEGSQSGETIVERTQSEKACYGGEWCNW